MMNKSTPSLLLLTVAVLFRWQDPQPVTQQPVPKPQPAAEQPAAEQPAAEQPAAGQPSTGQPATQSPSAAQSSPAPEKPPTKVIGKPEPSPLEGVYRLRQRVTDGIAETQPSVGYLAITNRHMFLNLASTGLPEGPPLLHAGVREWRKVGEDVRTTAKLDYYTDGAGEIFRTPDGKQEMRRIQLVRGGVRVIQDAHSWLEFERIE